MKKLTNKELVEKYPFLIIRTDWYTGKPLSEDEINYEHTWWDDIPEGWAKAFGIQMCDELLEILKEGNCLNDYRIVQIKEKYGGLRWYDNGIPLEIREKYYTWLKKYEDLSFETCIMCGEPATHKTRGWINYVCESCYNEIESKRIK